MICSRPHMMLCTQGMAGAVTKQTLAGKSALQHRIDSFTLCVTSRRTHPGFTCWQLGQTFGKFHKVIILLSKRQRKARCSRNNRLCRLPDADVCCRRSCTLLHSRGKGCSLSCCSSFLSGLNTVLIFRNNIWSMHAWSMHKNCA